MKPKGINPFELHVEKIVLGAAALIVFGLAAKSFLVDPNAVTLGKDALAPSKVDDALKQNADKLKGQLDLDKGIEMKSPGRLTEWFDKHVDNPAQPVGNGNESKIALVLPTPISTEGGVALKISSDQYVAFDAPAPTELQAASVGYTLDPGDLDTYPGLAQFFPDKKPPLDIQTVHVAAHYDGTKLHAMLGQAAEDKKVIPAAWVNDLAMLDVVAQRQEMQADGSWGPTETVKVIPGQDSLRPELEHATYRDKDRLLTEAQQIGKDLYEPMFYDLMGGKPWTTEDMRRGLPKTPEMIAAETQMKIAWKNFQDANTSLDRFEEAQKKKAEQDKNKGTGAGSGFAGGKGSGEGSSFGEGSSPVVTPGKDDKTKDPVEIRRTALRKAVADSQNAYEQSKQTILNLDPAYDDFPDLKEDAKGKRNPMNPTGRPMGKGQNSIIEPALSDHGKSVGGFSEGGGGETAIMPRGKGASMRGMPNQAAKDLFDNNDIQVWVHDINVKPGATYRYRLEIGFLNPFLGRTDRLAESQKKLADGVIAYSEPTAWSDPVHVMAKQQFFAVSGSYSNNLDERTARFEVYTFTNGEHHEFEVTAHPGDPIGEDRTIMPPPPPVAQSTDTGTSTGFGEGASSTPPPPPPGTNEAKEPPKPIEVNFSTGAVLLDVIQVEPHSTSALDQKVRIVVAMPDGTIRVFDPSTQVDNPDRLRLRDLSNKS